MDNFSGEEIKDWHSIYAERSDPPPRTDLLFGQREKRFTAKTPKENFRSRFTENREIWNMSFYFIAFLTPMISAAMLIAISSGVSLFILIPIGE